MRAPLIMRITSVLSCSHLPWLPRANELNPHDCLMRPNTGERTRSCEGNGGAGQSHTYTNPDVHAAPTMVHAVQRHTYTHIFYINNGIHTHIHATSALLHDMHQLQYSLVSFVRAGWISQQVVLNKGSVSGTGSAGNVLSSLYALLQHRNITD